MTNNLYIINATATKFGGALTILKEFLHEAEKSENKSVFYVFCGAKLNEFRSENIIINNLSTDGFGFGGVKRFLWDALGLYLFCIFKGIKPDIVISFQNTGVYFPGVKQLIYYHQLIPLYDYKWKLFNRNESALFFYKNIYPFFIRLFTNRYSEFVVQQEFIKKLFQKRFKIPSDKVHVIVPKVNIRAIGEIKDLHLNKDEFHLFFPTNQFKYKNYITLFESIGIIKKKAPDIFEKILLHITLEPDKSIGRVISKYQINDKIRLLGNIPNSEVINYYKSVNLLVFPSYIETFGLPLVEAASFGLPIIVSDMEYAHESLKNYKGVKYVNFDDPLLWAEEIIEFTNNNHRFESYKEENNLNSWSVFLQLSSKIIGSNV